MLDQAKAHVPGQLVRLLPLSTVEVNVSEVVPDFDLKGRVPINLEGAPTAVFALDLAFAVAVLTGPVAYATALVALLIPYLTSGLALQALNCFLAIASFTLALTFSMTVGASQVIVLVPTLSLHNLAKV